MATESLVVGSSLLEYRKKLRFPTAFPCSIDPIALGDAYDENHHASITIIDLRTNPQFSCDQHILSVSGLAFQSSDPARDAGRCIVPSPIDSAHASGSYTLRPNPQHHTLISPNSRFDVSFLVGKPALASPVFASYDVHVNQIFAFHSLRPSPSDKNSCRRQTLFTISKKNLMTAFDATHFALTENIAAGYFLGARRGISAAVTLSEGISTSSPNTPSFGKIINQLSAPQRELDLFCSTLMGIHFGLENAIKGFLVYEGSAPSKALLSRHSLIKLFEHAEKTGIWSPSPEELGADQGQIQSILKFIESFSAAGRYINDKHDAAIQLPFPTHWPPFQIQQLGNGTNFATFTRLAFDFILRTITALDNKCVA